MKVEEVHKIINELKKYSEIEGTEIGELCGFLETIYGFGSYYLTEGFEKAVISEIQAQLDNFKTYAKIVKKKRTTTHEFVDLEWEM